MPWAILSRILRALGLAGILLFVYMGVAGIYGAFYSAGDGRELSMIVGFVFLFLAAMLFWWWTLKWDR